MKKLLLPFLLLGLWACSSPKESLDKQNYDKAFNRSSKKLKKGKSVETNKAVLIQSMEQMLLSEGQTKAAFLNQGDIASLESALKINQQLSAQIQKAEVYTAPHFADQSIALEEESKDLVRNLGEMYFQRGEQRFEEAMTVKQKNLFRLAYDDLSKAKRYGWTGAQADSLQAISLSKGQVNILIESNTLFDISYGWEVDRQFEELRLYSNLFTKIHYDQLSESVDPDCIVVIDFRPLHFHTDNSEDVQRYEQQVIVDYEVTMDTSGMEIRTPIYERVEGEVITRRSTKTGSWTAEVRVNPMTADCSWTYNIFQEEISSEIEELIVQGDERAIPDEYRGLRDDQEFMEEEEMAQQLIVQIYNRFLSSYF